MVASWKRRSKRFFILVKPTRHFHAYIEEQSVVAVVAGDAGRVEATIIYLAMGGIFPSGGFVRDSDFFELFLSPPG